jgi:hypothetical protein
MTQFVGEVKDDIQEYPNPQTGVMPEKFQKFHLMNGQEDAVSGGHDVRGALLAGEHSHLPHDSDGFNAGKLLAIVESDLQRSLQKNEYFERFLSGATDDITLEKITACADMENLLELGDGQSPEQRNLLENFDEFEMMMERESPLDIYPQFFFRRIFPLSPIYAGSPRIFHFSNPPGLNGLPRSGLPGPSPKLPLRPILFTSVYAGFDKRSRRGR